MQRIQRGDAAAFEEVVRGYGPRLARFAVGILGAEDDADDVVQDVLWRIWEGRRAWRPPDSLRAYLFASVRNRALNMLEHRRVRDDHRAKVASTETAECDERESPVDAVVAAEEARARHRVLARAFAALTERQRTAVRLRYTEGLAMAEVAGALRVSVSAAEQLIARALRTLRAEVVRVERG